jgi:hypothetical protein
MKAVVLLRAAPVQTAVKEHSVAAQEPQDLVVLTVVSVIAVALVEKQAVV